MDRARVSSPLKLDISRDSFRSGMEIELGEVVKNGWEEGLAGWAAIMLTQLSQESEMEAGRDKTLLL